MAWRIKIIITTDDENCPYRQEIEDTPDNWFGCCHTWRRDEDPCECLEEFCPLKSHGD